MATANSQSIQRFIEIPLSEIQVGKAKEMDITIKHCCCIFGKNLKKDVEYNMVHLLENGNILSYDGSDAEGSQGFFPVGNECKKRLVINFAF